MTMVLIAINVLVYAGELASGGTLNGTGDWIYERGALVADAIYADGSAAGRIGPCRDYLLNTVEHLDQLQHAIDVSRSVRDDDRVCLLVSLHPCLARHPKTECAFEFCGVDIAERDHARDEFVIIGNFSISVDGGLLFLRVGDAFDAQVFSTRNESKSLEVQGSEKGVPGITDCDRGLRNHGNAAFDVLRVIDEILARKLGYGFGYIENLSVRIIEVLHFLLAIRRRHTSRDGGGGVVSDQASAAGSTSGAYSPGGL